MPVLNLPSAARLGFVVSHKGKTTDLTFAPDRRLLFFDGVPVAALSGRVVFFYCLPGAEQRAVNTWQNTCALVRCQSAAHFDFVVGSTLTTAGLPLTQGD